MARGQCERFRGVPGSGRTPLHRQRHPHSVWETHLREASAVSAAPSAAYAHCQSSSGASSCPSRQRPARTSPVDSVRTPTPDMTPAAHSPSYVPPCGDAQRAWERGSPRGLFRMQLGGAGRDGSKTRGLEARPGVPVTQPSEWKDSLLAFG